MQFQNKTATKRFILQKFESMRPGMPITRISADAIDQLGARLRALIIIEVQRHPSIGRMFKI